MPDLCRRELSWREAGHGCGSCSDHGAGVEVASLPGWAASPSGNITPVKGAG